MTSSYVTYEDFERLQRRVKELEHILEQKTVPSATPIVVNTFASDFGSKIFKLAGVEEARYCMVNRCVTFYVIVDKLENSLLRKIARVEIVLSRKFPALSVNVAPVLNREEIPDECQIVSNK